MISRNVLLVTGANGFVGSNVCSALGRFNFVRAGVRKPEFFTGPNVSESIRYDLSTDFDNDWTALLRGVDIVIHCAARVHVIKETSTDPLVDFCSYNVDGTLRLAQNAAAAGVKRFVFISSIGVNGSRTTFKPFAADDLVSPFTPYAISKYRAELELRSLARTTGMEFVIIRPPLVYGPGAPGNFNRLMRILSMRVPLPLGGISTNKRSLVCIDNLVDLINCCLTHPKAANQIFLVSDGEDISTVELLNILGNALCAPPRLMTINSRFLSLCANFIRRPQLARQLCESLQIDITKTQHMLGWIPPVRIYDGLQKTARHWVANSA